ncbi:MAG: D-tyrosyl-tRNA(Tyr) deacylase, partial [Actinomycetales bacterium]
MRAVVQRVSGASVVADGAEVGRIGPGLVVLLGVTHDDDDALARRTADKVAGLRIMRDEQSVVESGGSVLVI